MPLGHLSYQVLNELIPAENQQFADVWDIIVASDGGIYFRSDERLFLFKNKQIRAFSSGGKMSFLGSAAGRLVLHDANNGLMEFDGQHFNLIQTGVRLESPVTAMIPLGADSVLVTTLKNGIFCLVQNQLMPGIPQSMVF